MQRPHAKMAAVCAGSQGIDVQATTLPLPDSLGTFPYIDVTTTQKEKEAILITAGIPLKAKEKQPNISIEKQQDGWLVKAKKGKRKLDLKIYDRCVLPEFEVVEFKN